MTQNKPGEKKKVGGVTFLAEKSLSQSPQFSRWDIGDRYGVERGDFTVDYFMCSFFSRINVMFHS